MDKTISLAEFELVRIEWSSLREIRSALKEAIVSTDYVSLVMKDLLNAKSPEEAEKLYWKIENNVFVQGQLFEAAEYLVPVLMASLMEVREDFIKTNIFELLFQIVAGEPHQYEIALGNSNLAEKCRAKAREGLWILYKELINGDNTSSEMAFEILQRIETDFSRLETFLKAKRRQQIPAGDFPP